MARCFALFHTVFIWWQVFPLLHFVYGIHTLDITAGFEQGRAALHEYAFQSWNCCTLGWLAYNEWVVWMERLHTTMPWLMETTVSQASF
jgi:hypothetical protein